MHPETLLTPGSLSTHPHMSPDHHGQHGFSFYCFQRTAAKSETIRRGPPDSELPLAPSSPLHTWQAPPFLPSCPLQKTTTSSNTQFGEASEAPHPYPGLSQTGGGVKTQLGSSAPARLSYLGTLSPLSISPRPQLKSPLLYEESPYALTFWSTIEQASCFT